MYVLRPDPGRFLFLMLKVKLGVFDLSFVLNDIRFGGSFVLDFENHQLHFVKFHEVRRFPSSKEASTWPSG